MGLSHDATHKFMYSCSRSHFANDFQFLGKGENDLQWNGKLPVLNDAVIKKGQIGERGGYRASNNYLVGWGGRGQKWQNNCSKWGLEMVSFYDVIEPLPAFLKKPKFPVHLGRLTAHQLNHSQNITHI